MWKSRIGFGIALVTVATFAFWLSFSINEDITTKYSLVVDIIFCAIALGLFSFGCYLYANGGNAETGACKDGNSGKKEEKRNKKLLIALCTFVLIFGIVSLVRSCHKKHDAKPAVHSEISITYARPS